MNEEKLKKVETKKYWTEEKSGVERRGEKSILHVCVHAYVYFDVYM